MKVKLLKRQKVDGEAGEIVEVSPDRALFLLQNGAGEPVDDVREQTDKSKRKAKGRNK